MDLVWARLKGGYDRAYEATGVRNHAETFPKGASEADITAIVRHCGQEARDIAGGETSVVLDDDIEDAEFQLDGEEFGEMSDF